MKQIMLVVTLIAALTAMTVSSQTPPSPPETPLRVDAPVIEGPAPRWIFGEPSDTDISVRVSNQGTMQSAGYTVRYIWEAANMRRPLNEDNTTSFDVGGPLAPGESRTHTAEWRLQPGQIGLGTLIAQLEETTSREGRLPVLVPSHDFGIQVVGTPQTIGADGTAFWRLRLQNNGNVPEEFRLELGYDSPRLDERLLAERAWVAAGSTGEVRLRIHYLFAGNANDFTETGYVVEARISSLASSVVRSGTIPSVTVDHDQPLQTREFSVAPQNANVNFVSDGQTVTARFTLRNSGNASESYGLLTASEGGWSRPVFEGSASFNEERVLAPGEASTVSLVATSPAAPPGTAGRVRLQVLPLQDQAVATTANASFRLHGPALTIEDLETTGAGPYAGDALRASTRLRNLGDEPSPTAGVVMDARSFFSDGHVLNQSLPVPRVAPGEATSIALAFGSIPAPGPTRISVRLATGPAEERRDLDVVVRRAALSLTPPPSLNGLPGEAVSYRAAPYTFVLRNEGDHPERFGLDVAQGTAAIEGPRAFVLDPGEQRRIPILHVLPQSPGATKYFEATVRAFLASAPHHYAEAKANTSVRDTRAPEIRWNETLPSTWQSGFPLVIEGIVADQTALADVWLRLEGGGNVTVFPIDVGGPWLAQVTLSEGSYTVSLWAEDVHGNRGSSGNHSVNVIPRAPPQVLDVTTETNLTGPQTISARILSARPLASVVLWIDDGVPIPLTVQNGSVAHVANLLPGNHTIEIRATDVDGLRGSSSFSIQIMEEPGIGPATDSPIPAPTGNAVSASGPIASLVVLAISLPFVRRAAKEAQAM